jgi:acetoacetyl-CoA synthetase
VEERAIVKQPLWIPSADRKRRANLTRFLREVNGRYRLHLESYPQLWEWSVARIPEFWAAMWDFAGIKASMPYDRVVDDLSRFPGARWFPGARLNFAENLLGRGDGGREALVFRDETRQRSAVTYAQLRETVARLAAALRAEGIGPGDRVVAYMPNLIETVVAMLAATSIGAVWASCATDIAPAAAVDRLGQVGPAVLFTADGYIYKGRRFDTLVNAGRVAAGIPTLKRVVVVPHLARRVDRGRSVETARSGSAGDGDGGGRGHRDGGSSDRRGIPHAVDYDEFLARGVLIRGRSASVGFEQLPADHPVFIMFSSGTTGKPKCLVQGAGGVLINHLKELLLHSDLRADDRITYLTTCSWMMWNWLVSALAVGATVVLYDGSPTHPEPGAMWALAQDERISVFGCSASYLNFLQNRGVRPRTAYDLASLKEISQTGSPLSAEGFEYVYREIKTDLHFNSISGGTDINGCFAAGNPLSPVYAGELQGPALAMKVASYDDAGTPVFDRPGELVCEAPSPSMPLYFWDDAGGRKYREAYFTHYPAQAVWRHGDYITMHSDTGGITFHGRSDTVLKPSGVRIGTAEIYNVVERIEGVADSLAVGQNWQGDQRIILFVKLADGAVLTDALKDTIKKMLRERASPRHVPALILEAPDIPYTLNMKKVESAVMNIANGRPVANRDALVNPEALAYFEHALAAISPATEHRESGDGH